MNFILGLLALLFVLACCVLGIMGILVFLGIAWEWFGDDIKKLIKKLSE